MTGSARLPGVIWTSDAQGSVASIGDNVSRIYGFTPAEIVQTAGLLWFGRIHPEDVALVRASYAGLFDHGELFDVEYRIQHKDGRWVWLHSQAMSTFEQGGRRLATGIAMDATAWREAEEELHEARLAAETADRAKSEFMATMSHELRTPLNAIIGFSELLEDQTTGGLTERQQKYVRNILQSGRDLLHLINQVLDLTKVETGRLSVNLTSFSVSEALNDVQLLLRSSAQRKRHRINLVAEPALPMLTADEPKFKQITYCLLSNAIKFTPDDGQIEIAARASARSVPGEALWIEVAVTDNGPGIAAEDRERAFRLFERGDPRHGRAVQGGAGMGLPLARRLVELQGGSIALESALGQGTTVTFRLPSAVQTGVTPVPDVRAAMDRPVQESVVLVVEDNVQASELLGHYLSEAGYGVVRAYNGADALQLARTINPAAITLDTGLPDQDGLEVLAALQFLRETANIPVIIVSVSEVRQPVGREAAFAWLVKPVQRQALLEAVQQAIAGSAPRRNH